MPKRIKLRPLTKEERIQLEKLSRSATESHRIVERAKMILLAHQGMPIEQIANKLDRSKASVYLRLKRFDEEGIAGLQDKPGKGRKPTVICKNSDPKHSLEKLHTELRSRQSGTYQGLRRQPAQAQQDRPGRC